MKSGALKRLAPLAWIGGIALALCLSIGHGFANYDTFYSLVWGDQIAHGAAPDYDGVLPPTPHPLATLVGVLLAPFGDGAETIVVAIAYLSLATIGYLVYRLGELWVNRWVGLLAAAIVLTRQPVLDYGVRGYLDLPYIALVLGALVVETRRSRAGWPVLVLLGLAGLLRPEAWLFSAAYLVYLAYSDPERPPERLAPLKALYKELLPVSALAAAAPLLWAAFDLAVTGDPLYSLTGTRDTVETLGRDTGIADALRLAPRRLGEILREPVLIGAIGGAIFSLALLRGRKVLVGAAAVVVALAAFVLLAGAGLAVITRYLLLSSVLVAIFAAAGALGWLSLERSDRWRIWWMGFGAAVVVGVLVLAPQQAGRLSDLRDSVADQEQVREDLETLVDGQALSESCGPVTASSTQAVPLLAQWLDRDPSQILVAGESPPSAGYVIEPANPEVAERFALDENDPGEQAGAVPPGFEQAARNESWLLYRRCA